MSEWKLLVIVINKVVLTEELLPMKKNNWTDCEHKIKVVLNQLVLREKELLHAVKNVNLL